MKCPNLSDLPSAPANKTGWPWTEESFKLPDRAPDGSKWPRLTVVTPSFNQGQYLEETIRSVLLQGYPNLEYFVFDGGSTDNSVEIIKKYNKWFAYWVSESDDGQSAVINRGLKMGSGLYATWINSDDLLCKNAFFEHASRIGFAKDKVYVGNCVYITEGGEIKMINAARIHSLEDLVRIRKIWRSKGNIAQPEVLFPRELFLELGALDEKKYYCMDYELWGKFLLSGVEFQYTGIPIGIARQQKNQKTAKGWQNTKVLIETASELILLAEEFSEATKRQMLRELADYKKYYWKQTGVLAQIGLPPRFALPSRKILKNFKETRLGSIIAKPIKKIRDSIKKH
jgi:GT2 family glycosyltransferase